MVDSDLESNYRALGTLGYKPFFDFMVLRVSFLRLCGPAAGEGPD